MTRRTLILGIETSCDETAAAVIARDGEGRGEILSNVVLSQLKDHAPYGGVVPEIAARAHVTHLDRLVAQAMADLLKAEITDTAGWRLLASPLKDLVFDLAELKFISSAGLRVFSIVRKQLKERGGQASFINMQPQITEVFEIIKALPGVGVFASEAEFDSYLTARQKMIQENQ